MKIIPKGTPITFIDYRGKRVTGDVIDSKWSVNLSIPFYTVIHPYNKKTHTILENKIVTIHWKSELERVLYETSSTS